MIVRSAGVPIYGFVGHYVGLGAVGGYVINHEAIGKQVARMALQVAAGVGPRDIPVENAAVVPTFDWRQLRRRGESAKTSCRRGARSASRSFLSGGSTGAHPRRAGGDFCPPLLIAFLLLECSRRQRATQGLKKSEEQF